MTHKHLETLVLNLQEQVKKLAAKPLTARAEQAETAAKMAKASADAASSKADNYEDEITTLALAQEELFTEIIPEMLEETEA